MSSPTLSREKGTLGRVGPVEYLVFGDGEPVTVFAHGLAGSISEIKPLAMPLGGTRVLFHFRGHGNSDPLETGWDYDLLAEDLLTVADHFEAKNACGLSLGSGAILRVLMSQPDRFARLGFVMPAAIDQPRSAESLATLMDLGAAIRASDAERLCEILLQEVPVRLRDERVTRILIARRARELAEMAAPAPAGVDVPVPHRDVLTKVSAPALVLAQAGDRLHSVEIAEQLTSVLPAAKLKVLEPGGVFWTQLDSTRTLLAAHFAA